MAFLDRDESQIRYYEVRIKKMPLPVLRRHGVVDRNGDLIELNTAPLTYQERAEVMALCEQKLGAFLKARGAGHLGLPATRNRSGTRGRPLPGVGRGEGAVRLVRGDK